MTSGFFFDLRNMTENDGGYLFRLPLIRKSLGVYPRFNRGRGTSP